MSDTKLATATLRMKYWAEIIHDRTESGLPVYKYCQEKGLSKNAYLNWLKKIKDAALKSAWVDFVELDPFAKTSQSRNAVPDFEAEAVVSVGRIDISVNSSTPKNLLATILEVAANA